MKLRLFTRLKQATFSFYRPCIYEGFNEGVSLCLFSKKRTLRLLTGWEPIGTLLRMCPQFQTINVNSRIVEIPLFFTGFSRYGEEVNKILDFGCVESKILIHLANLGFEVTGIDLRPYRFNNVHPKIRFIQGDIFDLKEYGTYDLINALSVVEHIGLEAYGQSVAISNQDEAAIRHLKGLLKPGKLMYLTVPYGRSFLIKDGYRIYDEERICQLVEGFSILEKHIYARIGTAWESVSSDLPKSSDEAVCILWLRKSSHETV